MASKLPLRILVVEDQALIALALADELEAAGHEVVGPASTPEQALRAARERAPDLAFVDLDLAKGQDGLSLAGRLHDADIPVVFTTACPQRARSSGLGIGIFTKPYDPAELVRCVRFVVELSKGHALESQIPIALELLSSRRPRRQPRVEMVRPILLIEDHPKDLELALEVLATAGLSNPVVSARNGAEALQQLIPSDCAIHRCTRR